jgi:hypothetical protein
MYQTKGDWMGSEYGTYAGQQKFKVRFGGGNLTKKETISKNQAYMGG